MTETHHEIVGWHFSNEKGLANLQKQAVREGGQILDLRNNSQSPSDPTGTDNITIPPSAKKSSAAPEKIISKITEATGYDGFIKDNVYIVFNPTQIKSATDNIGTFDGANSDIRYSRKSRQRNQINPVIVDGVVRNSFSICSGSMVGVVFILRFAYTAALPPYVFSLAIFVINQVTLSNCPIPAGIPGMTTGQKLCPDVPNGREYGARTLYKIAVHGS